MALAGIHRRLPVTITDALRERHAAKVLRKGDDECWPWVGSLRNGYGAIKHEKRVHSAHRIAYMLAKGEIADDLLVTHSCDNRMCCNPNHLIAGTYSENSQQSFDRRNVNTCKGSKAYNAILTEESVRHIWALRLLLNWGAIKIGKALGLGESTVKGVIQNKNWNHVTKPTAEEAAAIVAVIKGIE